MPALGIGARRPSQHPDLPACAHATTGGVRSHMSVVFARPTTCVALLGALMGCSATTAAAHAPPSSATPPARPSAVPEQSATEIPEQAEPEPLGPIDLVEPAGSDGWLGAALSEGRPDQPGALVKAVVPRSPAARGDLRRGDLIVSADGTAVSSVHGFIRWVRERPAGSRIRLGVNRNRATRLIAVELTGVPSDDDLLRMQFVGLPAPELQELALVQGPLPASLSALRGQVVVVEFWASWCAACQALVPLLNGWLTRYGDQGLSLIAISVESADESRLAVRQLGIEYTAASDESLATSKSYHGSALPTLFVIDQSGTVQDVMVGYSTPRLVQLEALIARLVGRG